MDSGMNGIRRGLCLLILLLSGSASAMISDSVGELKNLFRIDHKVTDVLLLVQREYGSDPVILVLPDGSKWYAHRHPEEVDWAQGLTGDIIFIPKPMAGPWQLLGALAEGSTITKGSQLSMRVEPIPQPVFQGERLKLTAWLDQGSDTIRLPGLDYLLNWQARFIDQSDFHAENVAAYQDNGEMFDEKPDDGIFTSSLQLEQAAGEYVYEVKMSNNAFERAYRQAFTLSNRPISIGLSEDPSSAQKVLHMSIDTDIVVLDKTHLILELIGPTGERTQQQLQSIMIPEQDLALPQLVEPGAYRLNVSAMTNTKSGRELYLTLPTIFFSFNALKSELTPEALRESAQLQHLAREKSARNEVLVWIVWGNCALVFCGGLAVYFWRQRPVKVTPVAAPLTQELDLSSALEQIDLNLPAGKS